ncbi:DEAD-box ATP-dependent RNA helicase CshA [Clostridium homopropionicum DSM 5847]|uniref:DEAD-box ATP-dependent RNA helicase CshA n=1 Tax=Clostridium homopropionicum DSM 5847 TaxID=1121318 RepID=A0A0L6ZBN3_9CLOT|nr:DEAD/DEAH box helicase [Clostridium homopropionicum]KOA20381.1 DEAD-box ATP-dependent RNA helicase CshA [Clostridium homopropionicum DSM 5847]SFG74684.1 Superfamily II DNA and RNA helicase [Clostridium homopropionicum]
MSNKSFQELGLNEAIVTGLNKLHIIKPTSIQEKAIPEALLNKDIIGQSETGSGKTLAYLLPIFQKVDLTKREMQAIILAPTHELAMQIDREITALAENSNTPVTSAPIIGEVNIKRQIEKLKEKPHIIVGSSGRILELIKKKKITAHTIKTIVIDEGDKLLDQNNLPLVKDVIKTTMRDRQLMVFSATINSKTLSVAQELMKSPVFLKAEETVKVNPNITHMYFKCENRDKIELLRKLIASINPEKAIVFINKNEETRLTTSKLQYHKVKAEAIYGNASKEERKTAIDSFRTGKIKILVSSDLSARGLDVKGVTHIFNLDLPEEPENYLHRVGRTGRAGESGTAISIVTEREVSFINKYTRQFNINIEEKEIYKGVIYNKRKPKAR